ncbi:hypothetical protein LSH36_154g05034 [Paralvinella palmiformis]|uniref:Uncharacterized protein n=1 Tax=Paralvinella palmiformis TaxID=53620 RepID=A0AAD9JUI2_9ANNE|nr:hypothetical protein LSH36_154g05034 [Paralvinella palmiformis]
MALSRLKKMEDELQTLRIYYSLSQEANLRDQFHNTLETYQDQIKNRDSVMDQAYKENNQLLAQLKAALADKAQLEMELIYTVTLVLTFHGIALVISVTPKWLRPELRVVDHLAAGRQLVYIGGRL